MNAAGGRVLTRGLVVAVALDERRVRLRDETAAVRFVTVPAHAQRGVRAGRLRVEWEAENAVPDAECVRCGTGCHQRVELQYCNGARTPHLTVIHDYKPEEDYLRCRTRS